MSNYGSVIKIPSIYEGEYMYKYYDVQKFNKKWFVISIVYGVSHSGYDINHVSKLSSHVFRFMAKREAQKLWRQDMGESKFCQYKEEVEKKHART